MRYANTLKPKVLSAVEHVFDYEKGPTGLVRPPTCLARAKVKVGLANLTYNMRRLVWLARRYAAA